jgi:galactose mutarotase-like enzyme
MPLRLFAVLALLASGLSAAERYTVQRRPGSYPLLVLADSEAGVEASISPRAGGELCSLRYRWNGQWVELLYRACDYAPHEGWRGKAPLLWPATGATVGQGGSGGNEKAGHYRVAGKTYAMPFHGFAQNYPWSVDVTHADRREARALLSLTDSAETRKIYPFAWRLSVEYRLVQGRLFLVYTVGASIQNTGEMSFSIGNHMTFRTPFLPGSVPSQMRMETPAGFQLVKDARNLPTGATIKPAFLPSTDLSALPVKQAVPLGGYVGDPVLSLTDPQGLRLRIKHSAQRLPQQPFFQFNLWGDPTDGYFSPEPWVGAINSFHTKMGLVTLKPGESWRWTVELYPVTIARK